MSKKNKTAKPIVGESVTHSELLAIEPAQRAMDDFKSVLEIVSIEKHPFFYEIAAVLVNALKKCPHCDAEEMQLHGRYVVRLADLPYVDPTGRVMPVTYAISAQRYQCAVCGHGTVEPLPDVLKPIMTKARITKRLSIWLMQEIQTATPYETLARMVGYSKVWVRKWAQDIRGAAQLPRKPSRPGPKRKAQDAQ